MTEELLDTIRRLRCDYSHLGRELGEIINEQQDLIFALKRENKRLEREYWNLKQTKRRKK
ncbi:TPA: hypothetical protein U2B49_002139 [Streptococcus suis]|nr:hypothetical protein [Streptococcus suis]HEM4054072.1 hypothetical protein [Streptococcus suis]HEM5994426.1 hypothetical protein [Streptococcus suis]HEM6015658.1 hypothetical protein [Streptococcus suis]HEM6030965.1 hypothetical protein [Streptococcus suis]